MAFVSVMLVPVTYYLCIPLWLLKGSRSCFQFWAGRFLMSFETFHEHLVLIYGCWNIDSVGREKTRKVIADDHSVITSELSNNIHSACGSDIELDRKHVAKASDSSDIPKNWMDAIAREEERVSG